MGVLTLVVGIESFQPGSFTSNEAICRLPQVRRYTDKGDRRTGQCVGEYCSFHWCQLIMADPSLSIHRRAYT